MQPLLSRNSRRYSVCAERAGLCRQRITWGANGRAAGPVVRRGESCDGKGFVVVVENVPLVADGARDLGLKLSIQQLERFQRYMEVLIDWSERVSLTAVRDEEGIQRRRF